MSQESREQREFMRGYQDIRREISNEMQERKKRVKCSRVACDEVKTIGQYIRDLRREVKELTKVNDN